MRIYINGIQFQCVLDFKYAVYLSVSPNVDEWKYKFIPIVYFDHITGKEMVYTIGFWVKYCDGRVEWIEAVPQCDMKPEDKYLYAKRASESSNVVFRGLNSSEMSNLHELNII